MKFHSLDAPWDQDEFYHLSSQATDTISAKFNGQNIKLKLNRKDDFQTIGQLFADCVTPKNGYLLFDARYLNLSSVCRFWLKNGRLDRDGELPASVIEYFGGYTRNYYCVWYKNGLQINCRIFSLQSLPNNYLSDFL